MDPVSKDQVALEKQRTLSKLIGSFEELAKRFTLCKDSLFLGQPIEMPRREVDSVLSVQAGTFVLIALDNGYLKCKNSAAWDPRLPLKSLMAELTRIPECRSEGGEMGTAVVEPSSERIEINAAFYSSDDIVALEKPERPALSEQSKLVGTLLRQFEGQLDPRTTAGQINMIYAWWAFLREELIPQNEIHFRCDWPDRLPMLDSQSITQRNNIWSPPGKTKDDHFRFCIQARADIYATSCRIIAKLLSDEIGQGQSEMGVQGIVKAKRKDRVSRRTTEELFKSALRKHHKYESNGSVLNFTPISARGIETLLDGAISDTTAGRLLKKHFGSVREYQEACLLQKIGPKLVILLGDGLHAYGTFDPTKSNFDKSQDAVDE